MRKFFSIIILLCVIYYVGGWIAVWSGLFLRDDYFAYSGIVGGLATVVGLFALTRPALSHSDVQAIEVDALRSMTEKAAQLQALETARSKTQEEIGTLAIKKQEMELLVKKASLALFLKEQYAHHERRILEELDRATQLKEHLEKSREVAQKVAALNEEIEADPNVTQLKEIIDSASRKSVTLVDLVNEMPVPFNSVLRGYLVLGRTLTNLISSISK